MAAIMTLQDCIHECLVTNSFEGDRIPDKQVEILDHDGGCVGFYTPRQRKGCQCLGFVFIAEKFRRKGHAERVAREFLKKNPHLIWFANINNIKSQRLAEKIGLSVIRMKKTKRHIYCIYGRNLNN